MSKAPEKILIYRLGSLGDTVIALPCFHLIRKTYPNAEITLLTNKPVMSKAAPLEAILGSEYFFDRILAYPVGTRNPAVLLNLTRKIRAFKCQTVINITALRSLAADRRDKLFFRLAGLKNFIGFDNAPEDFAPPRDPATGMIEWEASRLARKIKSLGKIDFNNDEFWDLKLTAGETDAGSRAIAGIPSNARVLAVNAGTKLPVKDWGAENWLELIGNLSAKLPGWVLMIIGVPEEMELAQKLMQRWKGQSVNLCGKTSPRVSAEVLKRADLFIGHDSGPLHLAACVGVPVVGIYSGLNQPRQWFPRGENNVLIFPESDCPACKQNPCKSLNGVCILSISPAQVEEAVLNLAASQKALSEKD